MRMRHSTRTPRPPPVQRKLACAEAHKRAAAALAQADPMHHHHFKTILKQRTK